MTSSVYQSLHRKIEYHQRHFIVAKYASYNGNNRTEWNDNQIQKGLISAVLTWPQEYFVLRYYAGNKYTCWKCIELRFSTMHYGMLIGAPHGNNPYTTLTSCNQHPVRMFWTLDSRSRRWAGLERCKIDGQFVCPGMTVPLHMYNYYNVRSNWFKQHILLYLNIFIIS